MRRGLLVKINIVNTFWSSFQDGPFWPCPLVLRGGALNPMSGQNMWKIIEINGWLSSFACLTTRWYTIVTSQNMFECQTGLGICGFSRLGKHITKEPQNIAGAIISASKTSTVKMPLKRERNSWVHTASQPQVWQKKLYRNMMADLGWYVSTSAFAWRIYSRPKLPKLVLQWIGRQICLQISTFLYLISKSQL